MWMAHHLDFWIMVYDKLSSGSSSLQHVQRQVAFLNDFKPSTLLTLAFDKPALSNRSVSHFVRKQFAMGMMGKMAVGKRALGLDPSHCSRETTKAVENLRT